MKKKLINSIVLSVLSIAIIVISSIVFAWYTNTNQISKEINGSTLNLALEYEITNNTTSSKNIEKYSINDLSFFDVTNTSETAYFLDMATVLEIKVTNKSSDDITLKLQYDKVIQYGYLADSTFTVTTTKDEEKEYTSIAYCNGFFTTTKLTGTDLKSDSEYKSINSLTNYENTSIFTSLEKDASYTCYLYLFGVQEIISATNDFLDNTYNFSISFIGTKKETNTATTIN